MSMRTTARVRAIRDEIRDRVVRLLDDEGWRRSRR